MKAWTVSGVDSDYATVVFAETAGKAKAIAVGTDTCEDYDFLDIRAYRFKEMDKHYRGKREMDWYNDEDRTALVKVGWHCLDPDIRECEACCARELCECRVVRCKDCIWWHDNGTLTGFCERLGSYEWFTTDHNDYCSNGERKAEK